MVAVGRYDETQFVRNFPANPDAQESMYFRFANFPTLGGLFAITPETVVFSVPLAQNNDASQVRVSRGSRGLVNNIFYWFMVYDADRNGRVGAVVNFGIDTQRSTEPTLPWGAPLMLIERISTVLHIDEFGDEEIRTIVHGLSRGEMVNLLIVEDNVDRIIHPNAPDLVLEHTDDLNSTQFRQLMPGSVIQYRLDADDELVNFRVLYRPEEAAPDPILPFGGGDGPTRDLERIIGTVEAIDNDIIMITTDGGQGTTRTTLRIFGLPNNLSVYYFNSRTNSVEVRHVSDLVGGYGTGTGTAVMVRVNQDALMNVIILAD